MTDLMTQYLPMLSVAGTVVALWPVLRLPSVQAAVAASGVGAMGGLLIVLAYWLSGKSHPNAIAGLVQWNDAAGYLWCARELIAGVTPHPGCSMRPYYVAQFGTLLAASSGNVQVALLVQSGLVGAASGWFAHLIARERGVVAGMTGFAALLAFMVQFTLPVLTENAGLLLGLLSISILWLRAGSIAPLHFLAAMMILMLALNARAGAMLIVPALLVWSALWSGGDARQRMTRSVYGFSGVIAAILLTLALTQILGGGATQSHSNFAYTLYAMSVGKSTYLQIFFDHPEIRALAAPELSTAMYGFIWDNLKHRPELFILGYMRGAVMWALGLFDFVPNFHLRAILFVLALVGVWSCLKAWRGEREALLLVMFAAVAASAPFLFPYGGARILAATFPVDALLAARGAAYVMRQPVPLLDAYKGASSTRAVLLATAIAVLPLLTAPVLRNLPILSPVAVEVHCPAGQYAFVADLRHETTGVTLGTPGSVSLFPLVVARDRFVERIHSATHQINELKDLPVGTVLFDTMQRLPAGSDIAYGRQITFLWNGQYPQGMAKGCISLSDQRWLPAATSLVPVE